VFGKPDDVAMVEIFGARGQDLTYPEMKWWTDHMQVSGVNFMIPHSFNPKSPYDTDCPPYFYNGGYEPRWPLYRVYADYTSRLSLMLTGGRHVCPVALLSIGQSINVGRAVTPEEMTTALQDGQIDCDWLPYYVFESNSRISGKELQLHQERYKVLIVPPVEVIPYATLAKAKKFFDAGGVVVGYGFLPSKSATLGHSAKEMYSYLGREASDGVGQLSHKLDRRPFVSSARKTDGTAIAASIGRCGRSPNARSPRRRDQRLAACLTSTKSRAGRVLGVQSEPPRGVAAVQVPRHGRRRAGMLGCRAE
jgi:hypothetical protein